MSHFNSSSQTKEKLKSLQKGTTYKKYSGNDPRGVLTDVVTRWWSTLCMCDRILYLRTALNHLPPDAFPPEKMLQPNDWKNLEMITKVLRPFANVQKFLEGENYVTCCYVAQSIYLNYK